MCKASCKICALLRGPPLCPPPHGHFMAKQWWHATEKSQITVRPGKPIYIYKAELLGQVPSQSTVANSHAFTHTLSAHRDGQYWAYGEMYFFDEGFFPLSNLMFQDRENNPTQGS